MVVVMVVGVECAGVELMAGRRSVEVLVDVGWGEGVLPLVFNPAKFICGVLVFMLMV